MDWSNASKICENFYCEGKKQSWTESHTDCRLYTAGLKAPISLWVQFFTLALKRHQHFATFSLRCSYKIICDQVWRRRRRFFFFRIKSLVCMLLENNLYNLAGLSKYLLFRLLLQSLQMNYIWDTCKQKSEKKAFKSLATKVRVL